MKIKKPILTLIFIFFALVFLAACGNSNSLRNTGTEEEYTVRITPADFVSKVDNPYFPLIPGARYVYEGSLKGAVVERIEIEILNETREVMGVPATVFHDQVFADGQLVEDTYDWFAQDAEGNVWYLGEAVDNYEDGVLVDHEGAWEWGVDGALPGIIMWADPAAHVGQEYYQEYYRGEAEDKGQVISVSESVIVPFGTFADVLQTLDFTPLEPGVQAHKFYAQGLGTIKEVELGSGEEVVLIEYYPPGE